MRFTLLSKRFSRSCLRNSSNFRLIDAGPLSSFSKRSSSAPSFHASLLQVVDGDLSLPLCPQVVSQTLQHFRSSETPTTCGSCFSRQSVWSDISLHSAVQGSTSTVFDGGCRPLTHASLGFPFLFLLFFSLSHFLEQPHSICEDDGTYAESI